MNGEDFKAIAAQLVGALCGVEEDVWADGEYIGTVTIDETDSRTGYLEGRYEKDDVEHYFSMTLAFTGTEEIMD